MASVAERKRAKKAARTNTGGGAQSVDKAQPRLVKSGGYVRQKTGLEWLRDKGRISRREFAAGERYGSLMRTAAMEGVHSLKSCLDTDGVRGAGTPSAPGLEVLGAAEWIAQARAALVDARSALGHHSGMIAACDLICGQGMTAREITTVQREAEEIENGLRIALQMLVEHWGLS